MSTSYVIYNSPEEVEDLDQNVPKNKHVTVFPVGIYDGPVYPLSQYVAQSGPRNTVYDYLYNAERYDHPPTPSRFGYAAHANGYGVGSWSPGFYNTPACCTGDEIPKNMAPAKYYEDRFRTPYYTDSPAYRADRFEKNNRQGLSTNGKAMPSY